MESLNCGEKLGSCHTSLVVHTWDNACEASKKHSSTELASSSSPQISSSTPVCRGIQFSAGLGFFDGGNGTLCSLSCKELLRDPVWCTFLGILFLLNILYSFVSCLDFCWENKINITLHCIHTSATLVLLQDYLFHLPHQKLKTKCSGVSEGVSVGKLKKSTKYMWCNQIFSVVTVRWEYSCWY